MNIRQKKTNRPPNRNFFNATPAEVSKLLIYMSKSNNSEGIVYKTPEGYFFEKYSGYVFGDYSKHGNFTYYGTREDGLPIYYGKNTLNKSVFYSVSAVRKDYKGNIEYYLDLGRGRRFPVLEYYHTHPKNTYLSDTDMKLKLPGYAIGWDGIWRGAPPSIELPEIYVIP